MTVNRSFIVASTAIFLAAGSASVPALAQPRTVPPAPPSTAPVGSPASVDMVRTLPCRRFHQVPDGAWIMTGSMQAGTANMDTAVFPKGTAEAAILSQRCLP